MNPHDMDALSQLQPQTIARARQAAQSIPKPANETLSQDSAVASETLVRALQSVEADERLAAGVPERAALAPEAIAQARKAAQSSGKPAVEILEETSGMAPEVFVAALGAALGYATITMSELDDFTPAFDLLPYTEALARGCVVFRNASDALLLVFGNPFDPGLRPWAEERIPQRLPWRLAHAAERVQTQHGQRYHERERDK